MIGSFLKCLLYIFMLCSSYTAMGALSPLDPSSFSRPGNYNFKEIS